MFIYFFQSIIKSRDDKISRGGIAVAKCHKVVILEDSDMLLNHRLWDARRCGNFGEAIAGMAYNTSQNDPLDGVYAIDGTDDALVESHGQSA